MPNLNSADCSGRRESLTFQKEIKRLLIHPPEFVQLHGVNPALASLYFRHKGLGSPQLFRYLGLCQSRLRPCLPQSLQEHVVASTVARTFQVAGLLPARPKYPKIGYRADLLSGRSQVKTAAITWNDLEEIGKLAFDVWVDQPELNWAKEAWDRLTENGLTKYTDEVEKTEVRIRFLALAGLYHDFCYKAWNEDDCPMYRLWADEMKISGVQLGQLLGRDAHTKHHEDKDELHYAALRRLITRERAIVLAALLQAYGGTSGLLVSLWNSPKSHDPAECDYEEGCDQCRESMDEILNCIIDEKGPAYTWLDQGAEELFYGG